MRIVVNHLTRMREGHICVAGIDPDTIRHVRPVLVSGALTPALLARNGGHFDMACVVDIGHAVPKPQKPHVEDHVFDPLEARYIRCLAAGEFWTLLVRVSKTSLREILGSDLKLQGQSSWGTDVGQGTASLGCLLLKRMPSLQYRPAGQFKAAIRMHVSDGDLNLWAPVTDLRLYQADHATPDQAVTERIARRIRKSRYVILGMGLTRQFRPSSEAKSAHWLQVNSIHLETNPTWQLG